MIEKYKNLPVHIRASIWFILCNVLLKGISFFTAPLFTRLLPTDEYGKLTLFASYEQIILIFATWEVGLSPFQRGSFKFRDNKEVFNTTVILFGMIATLVVGFFILLFQKRISSFTEMPLWLLLVLLAYAFFNTAYVSWLTENKLCINYVQVSIMTVGMTVVQIACSLMAVLFIGKKAEMKMLFMLIPAIMVSLFLTLRRFRIHKIWEAKKEIKSQFRFLLTFTWPLVIHSLSYLVLAQADRIMIGKMINNSTAGIYGVSYSIASIVIIVQSGVLQVISPWIYHKMDEEDYRGIQKRIAPILLIVSLLYILFILVAPDIIILLYPEYYWEGIWCIPPISVGVYFMFMYSLFVTVEECLDQTKYVALVSIVCSLINVILNYFGIKLFGYIACAYTTLFSYMLFAAGHYYFMSKVIKEEIGRKKIFDGKLFFILSIVMVILMVGITFLYNSIGVRYILVAVLLASVLLKRKKILSIFEEIKNKQ